MPAVAYVCVCVPETDSTVPSPQSMTYEPAAGMVMSSPDPAVCHVVTNAVAESVTVTVTAWEAVLLPSETWTVMTCVPLWSAAGIQENAPVFSSMEAPTGTVPASENTRVSPVSSSRAVAVNARGCSSSTSWSAMSSSTGAALVSVTVTFRMRWLPVPKLPAEVTLTV